MSKLVSLLQDDLDNARSNHERKSIIRFWRRAAIETLHARGQHEPLPALKNRRYVTGHPPFWTKQASDDLLAILVYIIKHHRHQLERPK